MCLHMKRALPGTSKMHVVRYLAVFDAACAQAEPPPFTKAEERASHEGAEDGGQQLRSLDLDVRTL